MTAIVSLLIGVNDSEYIQCTPDFVELFQQNPLIISMGKLRSWCWTLAGTDLQTLTFVIIQGVEIEIIASYKCLSVYLNN